WPADAAQAGDLFDYDTRRQRATYRHQPNPYAFAFGHGLTYSRVSYEAMALASPTAQAPAPTHRHAALGEAGDVQVTVRVSNRGERSADELVQVYALPQAGTVAPRRLLVAYQRVSLEPGESREVALSFDIGRLAVWDPSLRLPGALDDWL